jgi:hypothetical protein
VAAVTVLIVIAVVTAGWITIREFQVQRTVYAKILEQKLDATRSQFRAYLSPMSEHLATLARWQEAGLLEAGEPGRLANLVVPLVDSSEQVAAVVIVPPNAPAMGFLRTDAGWRNIPADSLAHSHDTDWFRAAADDPDTLMNWVDFGSLPGDGAPALVATRLAGDTVLGLGIRSADLNAFAATAPITENGILIRRHLNGQVTWLAPQAGSVLDVAESGELLTSGRPEHETISQALLQWGRIGQLRDETFQFRHAGKTWWGVFYDAESHVDPGELGMIVPADDLQARLQTSTGKVTILFAVLLGLAMVAVVVVAFDYRNKWRRFARHRLPPPADQAALMGLIAGGETDHVEFKSTMRWNLHANKPGKEIELAWLKTVVAYLNTAGGFLMIGVKDDGEVLGLDKDDFKNDDKLLLHFENLIRQHVGLLHAPYIRADIWNLESGQVLLVTCERCPEPAYLRNGDDEKFFVRIGPSTHVMPASKIHDYLAERES